MSYLPLCGNYQRSVYSESSVNQEPAYYKQEYSHWASGKASSGGQVASALHICYCSAMEKLINGAVEFRRRDFEKHRKTFEALEKQQKPHTLFIGCSDSRVVPTLITKTMPGELFIIRNIANMVPPYRLSNEYLSTTSAIEYAVLALGVGNIIICGHSNCGGCAAVYREEEDLSHLPHTRKWLELARPVRDRVANDYANETATAREWITEQANILKQIKNLLSYPYIHTRYKEGKLTIQGWYYIIGTGEVFRHDKEKGYFELLNPVPGQPVPDARRH